MASVVPGGLLRVTVFDETRFQRCGVFFGVGSQGCADSALGWYETGRWPWGPADLEIGGSRVARFVFAHALGP